MAAQTVADPLERRLVARAIVCIALLAIGCALVVSLDSETPRHLPVTALESSLLLHVERALLVGAGVSLVSIFTARGWAGYFPSRISTTGAEYLVRSATGETVGTGDDTMAAVRNIEAKQLALAASLRNDIRTLEGRLGKQI